MSNICSTYLRIFPKNKISRQSSIFEFGTLFSLLLENQDGYSYGTPIFSTFGPYGKYLDIVFGAKGSTPFPVYEFYEKNKDELEIVFFRYFDDGGDYDLINELADQSLLEKIAGKKSNENRLCLYSFDKIRFQLSDKLPNPTFRKLKSNYFELSLNGTYLSRSDSSVITHFDNFKIDNYENAYWGYGDSIQTENDQLYNEIKKNAVCIEYFNKNKLVKYSITKEEYENRGYLNEDAHLMELDSSDNWMYFPFNSWENTKDPIYLKYIEMNQHTTLYNKS